MRPSTSSCIHNTLWKYKPNHNNNVSQKALKRYVRNYVIPKKNRNLKCLSSSFFPIISSSEFVNNPLNQNRNYIHCQLSQHRYYHYGHHHDDKEGGNKLNYIVEEDEEESGVVVQLKTNTSRDLHEMIKDFKHDSSSDSSSSSPRLANQIQNVNNGNNESATPDTINVNDDANSKRIPKFKPLFAEIDEIMGKVKRNDMDNFKYSDSWQKRRSKKYNESYDESSNSRRNGVKDESSPYSSSKESLDLTSFLDEIVNKNKPSSKQHGKTERIGSTSSSLFESSSSPKKSSLFYDKDSTTSSKSMSSAQPKKSIFDAFPIPKQKNPDAYDTHLFEQYYKVMREVIQNSKLKRKGSRQPLTDDTEFLKAVSDWLLKDEPLVKYDYPVLKDAFDHGMDVVQTYTAQPQSNDIDIHNKDGDDKLDCAIVDSDVYSSLIRRKRFREAVTNDGSQSQLFLKSLIRQKETFMFETGFTEDQYMFIVKAFNNLSIHCVKTGSSSLLSVAWEKIKESGIIPSLDAINTYLYITGSMGASTFGLSSSLSSKRVHLQGQNTSLSAVINILGSQQSIGNDQQKKNERNKIDFPTELALFHDLLFEPTEKSISLRVRRLVSQGNATEAERLLDSFPSSDDAKLRTYLPVLKLYCEQGNLQSALRLFKRMRDEPTVRLEPENYILLISSFAENGYFRMNSNDVEGVYDLGYKYASGPKLLDELLHEMAEDVLEITSASARRLYNAIATGFHEVEDINLKPIDSLGGLVTNNFKAEAAELIASRVSIDTTTGICPRSGVKLQLIKLHRDQRQQLHQSLLQLATTRFEEFSRDDNSVDYAEKSLNSFADWLNCREGKPFTAIVDGANVAYYMQNFEGGSFNFYQIEFMVEALEKMGETPLVVIPYKYLAEKFYVHMGARGRHQVIDSQERKILEKLMKKGQLYRVPSRCLDDYYWMLASVSNQTKSRNGVDLDVPVDNKDGRWPGARPMLISNDQMRDHKLGLFEPRLFRRWFGCYIVNYNFTAFVGRESVDREIGFSTADIFSREIQANETDAGITWHIPVSDWNLDDRFCIRIPSKTAR